MSMKEAAAGDAAVGAGTLMRGVVSGLRSGGLPLLVLWLTISAGALGIQVAIEQFTPPGVTVTWAVLAFAGILFAAVGGAAALRLMLGAGVEGLRPDRGFLECAGLLAVAGLLFAAPAWLNALLFPPGAPSPEPWIRVLVVVTAGPLIGFALLQVAVWPVARLVGRQDVTAAKAWERMRGAVLGYVVACLAVAVPFFAISVASVAIGLQTTGIQPLQTPVYRMAGPWIATAWAFYGLALAATVYRVRIEPQRNMAEVFD